MLPAPFGNEPVHETIVSKLDAVLDRMGNPGNNLLAVVPDIQVKLPPHPQL